MSLDSANAMEAVDTAAYGISMKQLPFFWDGIRHVLHGDPLPDTTPGTPEHESVQSGLIAGRATRNRL